MSERSLSDFPRLAGARQLPCPCPQGDFCGATSRRSARAPTAALVHVTMDGEELINIRAPCPSASGTLCPDNAHPSHRLLLCDPALGLPLGKGRWPVLPGT